MRHTAFHLTFWLAVIACLVFALSCATDNVTKLGATTGVAAGTGVGLLTFGAGLLSGGWSFLVGLGAGLLALFFSKAPPPPEMGATSSVDIPWFWIIFGALVFFKGEHLFNLFFRHGGWDSILKFLLIKRTIIPKKPKSRGEALRNMETP